ncbi:hypothetical protein MMC25_001239 [Agyrium rufum]|nr:hypothetical protein [Agyrium rufum]
MTSTSGNIFTKEVNLYGWEQDPRWTACDQYSFQHLHPKSRPNIASLEESLDHAKANGLPTIESAPITAKMFALQCKAQNVKHVLEVGTLGGYVPIWLTTENPELRVTTLEVNPKHAKVARENFERAGVSDRIEIIEGPGLESLPKIQAEIEEDKRSKFGFVFIDADKGNNWAYFDWAVKLCLPRATLYVDNIVWMGTLASEEEAKKDPDVAGARELVEKVGIDSRVDAVVIQTVGEKTYDGWLMAVVNP